MEFAFAEAEEFDDMRTKFPVVLILVSLVTIAMAAPDSGNSFISGNDVTWTSLGTNENSSVPLGNGDVALNVWTEQNGDILIGIIAIDKAEFFLLAKKPK